MVCKLSSGYQHEKALELVREYGLKPVMNAYVTAIRMLSSQMITEDHAPNRRIVYQQLERLVRERRGKRTRSIMGLGRNVESCANMTEVEIVILTALYKVIGIPDVWINFTLQKWSGLVPREWSISLTERKFKIYDRGTGETIETGQF